jgi:hypothetical protein
MNIVNFSESRQPIRIPDRSHSPESLVRDDGIPRSWRWRCRDVLQTGELRLLLC